MLVFIGLGLGMDGISLRGLEKARESNVVYAELYTSLIPDLELKQLERKIGKSIKIIGRDVIEENPEKILEQSKKKSTAFLVPGDPMVATTHIDLRLRAAKAGIETRVIHAASIFSAAAGLIGLQSYKFGPSATIPFPDNLSTRPYEILAENVKRGLHTLLLLDIRDGRAMTSKEAIAIMLRLEKRLSKKVFTPDTLLAVVARAGSDDAVVRSDRIEKLQGRDFDLPNILVVPGKLHFIEAEALRIFAGAPEETVS